MSEKDLWSEEMELHMEQTLYPLVNLHVTMERSTILNGQIHYFDLAIFNSKLLVYQRVFFPHLPGEGC